MNKKLIALAVAGALAAPLSAQAVDVSTYGSLGWKLVDADNASWEMKPTKTRLGWNASEATDYGKFTGQIEFDFDNDVNNGGSSNEIDTRRARIIWGTKGAGTFVLASRTPSGSYADMHSMVDIFSHGGYHYYTQGDHAGKLIAWKSPTSGGIYFSAALVASAPGTTVGTDSEDIDVTVWRAVWNSGPWHAAYGQVINNNTTNSDDTRDALGVSWKNNGLMVGFSWEDAISSSATLDGDTTTGVAVSYTAGNNTFKAAVYSRDSDITPANDGDGATTLEIAHAFSKNVTGFVTIDSVETGGVSADSTAFGMNMSF